MDERIIVVDVEHGHLVSSIFTPGFFVFDGHLNAALTKYRELLSGLGAMPMLDTRPINGAKEPQAESTGIRSMYVGFGADANFGDRWMYQVLRREMSDVHFVDSNDIAGQWHRAAPEGHFDLCVLGGGTLINQKPVLYSEVRTALAAGLPCVCFGTGVGNVARWGDHLNQWAPLLAEFSFLGVRGPLSMKLLGSLGLPRLRMVGDPCLLDSFHPAPLRTPKKKLNVWLDMSFSVREDADSLRMRHMLLSELASLEKKGRIAVHFYTTWNVYAPWVSAQLANYFQRAVSIQQLSVDETGALHEADLCITYRLHAFGAALMTGVAAICIAYEEKCLDFASFLDLTELVFMPGREDSRRLKNILNDNLHEFVTGTSSVVGDAIQSSRPGTRAAFDEFRETYRNVALK
jgi:polysaccharide pyruvyl transferase WcaK-like protein